MAGEMTGSCSFGFHSASNPFHLVNHGVWHLSDGDVWELQGSERPELLGAAALVGTAQVTFEATAAMSGPAPITGTTSLTFTVTATANDGTLSTAESIEWVLPPNRLHYELPVNMIHWRFPANRLHYTISQ